MTRSARLLLGLASAAALAAVTACDADDGGKSDGGSQTDLSLYSECSSVGECAIGEEEGGSCQTTPSTPDAMICTVECNTIAYEVPDPEVGGCYTPSPTETCAGGCCLIETVEVVNDFGDEEGSGLCVPQAP